MRKSLQFKIIIFIAIVFLIALTGHFHLHEHHEDAESHCAYCLLLNTGLIFSLPFEFLFFFFLCTAVFFKTHFIGNGVKRFPYQLRAPPFYRIEPAILKK